MQASETYDPLQAWQMLGQPTIAINANFFDVRSSRAALEDHRVQFPAGRLHRQHRPVGQDQHGGHRNLAYAGKQALSGGDEVWTALATLILPVHGAPMIIPPKSDTDYDAAGPGDHPAGRERNAVRRGQRSQAARPRGHRTAQRRRPERGPHGGRLRPGQGRDVRLRGRQLHPDQIQDLFRGLGSDTAVMLDGGGSSAIVARRDTGGMRAGAGSPRGSCDTAAVLCDARERALPSWLGFN